MWLEDDASWALAWQAEDNLKCSGCGLPRDVTMADGADRLDWHVHADGCAACEARDKRGKQLSDPVGVYLWVEQPSEVTGG